MPDSSDQSNKSKQDPSQDENQNLDLSGLSSMSLGPNWGSGNTPKPKLPREKKPGSGGKRPPRKERRAPGGKRREEAPKREWEEFKPIVDADFYPEEEPFKVLTQAIRQSCRTFELFEIARLILEKPDRHVVVVRDPQQKEGEPARLYASVPDGLPFRTEDEALNHVFQHYLEEFFSTESVEVDPPKGSFQVIHKCGITGELLAPPNYHRYQALCRQHHATKLAHLPYSKFEQKIESVRDEESINAWLEKMKHRTRYTLKADEKIQFDTIEDARLYLVANAKDQLIRPAYSARFSGKALALLNPEDPIRKSVEHALQHQIRFPLDTANHLRGRLRRMGFAVYKKGSKGISYVCAVKRRFRKPGEVLADNLQDLIEFLEAHPNFPAKQLPENYLGIHEPEAHPAPAGAPAESPMESGESEKTPDESETGESKESAPEDKESEDEREVSANDTARETDLKEPEVAAAQAQPAALSEEDKKRILDLKRDLKYLVSEGYVIEYSDGRLFVPPIREEDKKREEKAKEKPQNEAASKEERVSSEAPAAAEEFAKQEEPAPTEEPASTEEPAPTEDSTPAEETTPTKEEKPENAGNVEPETEESEHGDSDVEKAQEVENQPDEKIEPKDSTTENSEKPEKSETELRSNS